MSKYHNTKAACEHGHIHDSKKEAVRCNDLHRLRDNGEISDLQIQVPYQLIPATEYENMPNERSMRYVADFTYRRGKNIVVEDVKSDETRKIPEYVNKRKLFKYLFCRNGGVIFLET